MTLITIFHTHEGRKIYGSHILHLVRTSRVWYSGMTERSVCGVKGVDVHEAQADPKGPSSSLYCKRCVKIVWPPSWRVVGVRRDGSGTPVTMWVRTSLQRAERDAERLSKSKRVRYYVERWQ